MSNEYVKFPLELHQTLKAKYKLRIASKIKSFITQNNKITKEIWL